MKLYREDQGLNARPLTLYLSLCLLLLLLSPPVHAGSQISEKIDGIAEKFSPLTAARPSKKLPASATRLDGTIVAPTFEETGCMDAFFGEVPPTDVEPSSNDANPKASFLCKKEGDETLYVSKYNPEKLVPEFVAFKMQFKKSSAERNNLQFRANTALEAKGVDQPSDQYQKSGFDQGHLAPAKLFSFGIEAQEATFEFVNCAPQVPVLNQNMWKYGEFTIRHYLQEHKGREVYIISGTHFPRSPPSVKAGKLKIPSHFWSALYDPKINKGFAFYAENIPSQKDEDLMVCGQTNKLSGDGEGERRCLKMRSIEFVEKALGRQLFPARVRSVNVNKDMTAEDMSYWSSFITRKEPYDISAEFDDCETDCAGLLSTWEASISKAKQFCSTLSTQFSKDRGQMCLELRAKLVADGSMGALDENSDESHGKVSVKELTKRSENALTATKRDKLCKAACRQVVEEHRKKTGDGDDSPPAFMKTAHYGELFVRGPSPTVFTHKFVTLEGTTAADLHIKWYTNKDASEGSPEGEIKTSATAIESNDITVEENFKIIDREGFEFPGSFFKKFYCFTIPSSGKKGAAAEVVLCADNGNKRAGWKRAFASPVKEKKPRKKAGEDDEGDAE
eukprot:GILI01017134.1.p1 GENE.GILI01017134.1~~GILI01017134.1.p1  ORF type:complete len:620 (+),score=198.46 GILI01017134.1:75-1934(+)